MVTSGLCECGCGQRTPPVKFNDARRGVVAGQPARFIRGHYNRKSGFQAECSVGGCSTPPESRGWCHGHFEQWRRTGVVPTVPILRTPEERFNAKVDRTGSCWLWTGATAGGGRYGSFQYEGRVQRAHVVAWLLAGRTVPDGLVLDHLCRTTLCVNPDHLEPVSQRENVLRGTAPTSANARKTHCRRGHPLSGDNLYVEANGGRRCRACRVITTAERRARRKS